MRAGIIILSLVALIGGGVWVFLILFEKHEFEVRAGYSNDAKRNPYLAAQQFLQQQNIAVVVQNGQLDFDAIPTSHTVFIANVDSLLIARSNIDRAMQWVADGGFLIGGVGNQISGYDSLLNRFDIEPVEHAQDLFDIDAGKEASQIMREANERLLEQRKQQEEAAEGADQVPAEVDELTTSTDIFSTLGLDTERDTYVVELANNLGELSVEVIDPIVLQHPLALGIYDDEGEELVGTNDAGYDYELTAYVADIEGERLLQFDHGRGTFTAISSARIWNNSNIDHADHAYFLAYLLSSESTLHLYYDVVSPSLFEILKTQFFEALLAFFALLGLWLWRAGLRVQRVVEVVSGQRRQFAEHLSASAKFLASKEQYHSLLLPLKDDIAIHMRPFYPGFAQLGESAQVTMLAERTAMPKNVIQTWVRYCQKVDSRDEFYAALKIGNAIRKKL